MDHPRFIAVVGGSGSGKSWLAERMLAELGPSARLLSLDDFYLDLGHLPEAARDEVNFDDPAAIDWDALREVLDCLASGAVARLPSYDFASHTRQPSTRPVAQAAVILLDGLWLLHHAWLRERFVFTVFVDCPEEERLRRRLERDVMTRGRTPESVLRQFTQQVQPMHQQFVEPQRQWATRRVKSPLTDAGLADLIQGCLGP